MMCIKKDLQQNIQIGDVFIFEAENDWISKSIAFLTHSNVSHAAMLYLPEALVEMGLSGIGVNRFTLTDDAKQRTVYILRRTPEKPTEPLYQAAKKYVDAKTIYDMPSLFFLAGLLIYKGIRPTKKLQKITDLILTKVCKELDVLINHELHPEETYFLVCSQLVYQIYEDCGQDYHLKIQNGLLQNKTADVGEFRIVDHLNLLKNHDNQKFEANQYLNETIQETDELLAEQLYSALQDIEDNDFLQLNSWHPTFQKAKDFFKKIETLLEKIEMNIPIDALFVTPVDLLKNCPNLKQIAKTKIKWIP